MTDAEIRDHVEIRALGDRFADAANRRDYDAFVATFAPDGVWDIGAPMNVRVQGHDEIAGSIRKLLEGWEWFAQMPHAPSIRVRGDEASATWTMNEIGHPVGAPGGHFNIAMYVDRLRRENGEWRFTERVYRFAYLDETPLAGKIFGIPNEAKPEALANRP